ncbi:MAG: vWA domain-containing protein [Myxococcota bacterium]
MNLNAIIDPCTGEPILDFVPATEKGGDFYVVEDGVVKGLKLVPASEIDGAVALDLVFVIDTTGSMSGAIDGIKQSVNQFATFLADQNLDLRLGAIPYGDLAPLVATKTQAAFQDLTEDFGKDGTAFNTFIDGLAACYLGDCGGDLPENGLDAVMYAQESFAWRGGASRVYVLITDITLHQDADAGDTGGITEWNVGEVVDALRGSAVLHAVSPFYDYPQDPYGAACDLAQGTGGSCTDFYDYKNNYVDATTGGACPAGGYGYGCVLDLTRLSFTDTIAAGFVGVFVTADPTVAHDVRVAIIRDDECENKGESTQSGGYE